MGQLDEVTEATLARARRDPAFKQQLLVASLNRLLAVLYRRQHNGDGNDPVLASQLREGARLAARLADIIRAIDEERARAATAQQAGL
jgi:hypothetical protein